MRSRLPLALIGLAVLLVSSVVSRPLAAQREPASDTQAVLRPGDAVRIMVWRSEELSGEFDVAGDGTIRHPLYRQVKVTDVPFSEVERRIAALLAEYEAAPEVVVQPLLRVSVGGEVREPNLFALIPETTLAQAVTRSRRPRSVGPPARATAWAGGPTERGRLDRVTLLRDGRVQVLDLTSADATVLGIGIHSGDQILVGRRNAVWREVIAPAATLTAAVAALVSAVIRASN